MLKQRGEHPAALRRRRWCVVVGWPGVDETIKGSNGKFFFKRG